MKVILSPSLVILSEAKNLFFSAQGKLREESRIYAVLAVLRFVENNI